MVTFLKKISWEEECELDLLTGKGFIVKTRAFKKKGDEQIKLPAGTHSPKFGSDWGDDEAFADRYRCKCGHMKGKVFEGEICSECGHEVEFVDVDLDMFAWIEIKNHKIIQPLYYRELKSALGGKIFKGIIFPDKEINKDGIIDDKVQKNNPFYGIGLDELYNRYEEVLKYFMKKRKDKRELFKDLLANKGKVFSSYIPVYSSVLRPVSFSGEGQFTLKIDKKYNVIVSKSLLLNKNFGDKKKKKREKLEDDMILYSLQEKLNELWDLIFSQIDQKHGHIREQLLGGRINFSSRNVIIPDSELRADEVRLNYHTFAELFKYQIIHNIVKLRGVTYNKAYEIWHRGLFDNSMLEIMKYILSKDPIRIFINRNPTINYGSFIVMRVASIIEDVDDYTMAIPNQVLSVLNADFDGDILNIGVFVSDDIGDEYERVFNPRFNMFVDRNDGTFNEDMSLHKDQMIGLYQFNNI